VIQLDLVLERQLEEAVDVLSCGAPPAAAHNTATAHTGYDATNAIDAI
jgi:hypothetical protein